MKDKRIQKLNKLISEQEYIIKAHTSMLNKYKSQLKDLSKKDEVILVDRPFSLADFKDKSFFPSGKLSKRDEI